MGRKFFGLPRDKHKIVHRTVAAAIVGGTVSKIGGGKFANGAAAAAMVHLFNTEEILKAQSEEFEDWQTADTEQAKLARVIFKETEAISPVEGESTMEDLTFARSLLGKVILNRQADGKAIGKGT